MNVSLDTPISKLISNGRRVGALKALGVTTVADALTYYPFRVTDPVSLHAVSEARVGIPMAFAARVLDVRVVPMGGRRGFRLEALVNDAEFAAWRHVRGSRCRLVFFSHKKQYMDWLAGRLRTSSTVVVAGAPTAFNGQLQFTHPEILTVAPEDAMVFEPFDRGETRTANTVIGAASRGDDIRVSRPGLSVDGKALNGDNAVGNATGLRNPDTQGRLNGRGDGEDGVSAFGDAGAGPERGGIRYDARTSAQALARVCRPRPVYHASSRISSDHIHESILSMLDALRHGDAVASPRPGEPNGAHDEGESRPENVRMSGEADNESFGQVDPQDDPASVGPTDDIPALRQAIADVLPADVIAARKTMHRADAFLAIHDPQSTKQFREGINAMRYEEAFVSQVSVLQARTVARKANAFDCDAGRPLRERFLDSLPFELTQGQREVIDDICEDMGHGYPMQRLLQGEVGSGKTVVALAAMLQTVGAGYQSVLVAPTQVLAEQHAQSIRRMVDKLEDDVPVTLLTGGMKLAARRRALAQCASGDPGIIIATHAAFSKTFQAPNLALVVIDEQHRFGVEQRDILREKGDKTPHLLVMTATPIPRTAAMTWFGDLDISTLTELPGGRKPIRTVVVPEADANTMAQMFVHIRRRIDAGERAYVVCPRIEGNPIDDGDRSDDGVDGRPGQRGGSSVAEDAVSGQTHVRSPVGKVRSTKNNDVEGDFVEAHFGQDGLADAAPKPPLHAVDEIAERLASLPQFAGVAFSTLTGRDDDETKRRVMADFESGATPILVATTVIEVGVDVPQASCIVIFDADRYGLTQLHQLRGRVGRGGTNSWAFLVSRAEPGSIAEQRVSVVADTLDGAKIAEADLELRGAGDVLGDAQSGAKSGLKLLRVVQDARIIADARSQASALLARDPSLEGEIELAGAVLDFTRGGESAILSS